MGTSASKGVFCLNERSIPSNTNNKKKVDNVDPNQLSKYSISQSYTENSVGTLLRKKENPTTLPCQKTNLSEEALSEGHASVDISTTRAGSANSEFLIEKGDNKQYLEKIVEDINTFFKEKSYSTAFERAYIQPVEPSELTIYLKEEESLNSSNNTKSKYHSLVSLSIFNNISSLQQFLSSGFPPLSFEQNESLFNNIIVGEQVSSSAIKKTENVPSNDQKIEASSNMRNSSAKTLHLSSSSPQLPFLKTNSLQNQQQQQNFPFNIHHSFCSSLPTPQAISPSSSSNYMQSKLIYSWGDSSQGLQVQVISLIFLRPHFSKPRELVYVKVLKVINNNECIVACQSINSGEHSMISELEYLDHLEKSRLPSQIKKPLRKGSGSSTTVNGISGVGQNEDKVEKAKLELSGMRMRFDEEKNQIIIEELQSLNLKIDTSHYIQRQLIVHKQKKYFQIIKQALQH